MTMQPAAQLSLQHQSFSWQGSVVNVKVLFNAVADAFSSLSAQQEYQTHFYFGSVSLSTVRRSEAIKYSQVDLKIESGVMANGHNALRLPERQLKPIDAVDSFCEHLATALCSVGLDFGQAQRMSSRAKCALIPGSNPDALAKVSAIIAAMLNRIAMIVMPSIDVAQATERAHYANVIRRIEQRGIPCDVALLQHLRTDSAALWLNIVQHYDPEQAVYRNGLFDHSAFVQFVDAQGINFPFTQAGQPDLKKLGDMAKSFPCLKPINTLYKLDSQLRSQKLQLNSDNRLVAELKPLATITGRHAPSSNGFVMGLAKPFRSLVTPEEGSVLFVLDYVAQEVGISAVLSGDQALQRAYLHGDIYLTFAKQIGLAPDDATKQSHAAERDLCKTVFIAVLYGMGVSTLAQLLGCTHVDAEELLAGHRQNYPQLWLWQEATIKRAREEQELKTASGWRVFVDHSTKTTTLKNWPIQAVGADILRKAIMDCENAGLRVLAPLHDAIMFESSIEDHEVHIHQAQALMVNAAKHWLSDFPLRLDTQLVFPGQTLCPPDILGLKHFIGASSQDLYGDSHE